MRYVLQFHFDSGEDSSREALTQRFLKAGVSQIDNPEGGHPATIFGNNRIWFWDEFDWENDEVRDEVLKTGEWAETLFGGSNEELQTLIGLGEKVGFRIFDAGIKEYVTADKLDATVEGYQRFRQMAAEMFGTMKPAATNVPFAPDPDLLHQPFSRPDSFIYEFCEGCGGLRELPKEILVYFFPNKAGQVEGIDTDSSYLAIDKCDRCHESEGEMFFWLKQKPYFSGVGPSLQDLYDQQGSGKGKPGN